MNRRDHDKEGGREKVRAKEKRMGHRESNSVSLGEKDPKENTLERPPLPNIRFVRRKRKRGIRKRKKV